MNQRERILMEMGRFQDVHRSQFYPYGHVSSNVISEGYGGNPNGFYRGYHQQYNQANPYHAYQPSEFSCRFEPEKPSQTPYPLPVQNPLYTSNFTPWPVTSNPFVPSLYHPAMGSSNIWTSGEVPGGAANMSVCCNNNLIIHSEHRGVRNNHVPEALHLSSSFQQNPIGDSFISTNFSTHQGTPVVNNSASNAYNCCTAAKAEVPLLKARFAEVDLIPTVVKSSVGFTTASLEGNRSNEADLLKGGERCHVLQSPTELLANQAIDTLPTSEFVTASNSSQEVCAPETLILNSLVVNVKETCILNVDLVVDLDKNGAEKGVVEHEHQVFDEMSTRKVVGPCHISAHVLEDLVETKNHCSDNTHVNVNEGKKKGIDERSCPVINTKLEELVATMNKSDNSHINASAVPNALPEIVIDTLTFATNEGGNDHVVASESSGFETALDLKLGLEFDLGSQVLMEDGVMVVKAVEVAGEGLDATNLDEMPTCEAIEPFDKLTIAFNDIREAEKDRDVDTYLSVVEVKTKGSKLLWSEHVEGGDGNNSIEFTFFSVISLSPFLDVVVGLQAAYYVNPKDVNALEYIGGSFSNCDFDFQSESKDSRTTSMFYNCHQDLLELSGELDKFEIKETLKVELGNNGHFKLLPGKVISHRELQILVGMFELAPDTITITSVESVCSCLVAMRGKSGDISLNIWDPGITPSIYSAEGYFYIEKWIPLVPFANSTCSVSMEKGTIKKAITLLCSHPKPSKGISRATRSYKAVLISSDIVQRLEESTPQVILFLKAAAERCINFDGDSEADEFILVLHYIMLLHISSLKILKLLGATVDPMKWNVHAQNSHVASGVLLKAGATSSSLEVQLLKCERVDVADLDKLVSFCKKFTSSNFLEPHYKLHYSLILYFISSVPRLLFHSFSALSPAKGGENYEGCLWALRTIHTVAGLVFLVEASLFNWKRQKLKRSTRGIIVAKWTSIHKFGDMESELSIENARFLAFSLQAHNIESVEERLPCYILEPPIFSLSDGCSIKLAEGLQVLCMNLKDIKGRENASKVLLTTGFTSSEERLFVQDVVPLLTVAGFLTNRSPSHVEAYLKGTPAKLSTSFSFSTLWPSVDLNQQDGSNDDLPISFALI